MPFKKLGLFMAGCLMIGSCKIQKRNTGDTDGGDGTVTGVLVERGDILVSNASSDSVLLLDSEGNYKKLVVHVGLDGEAVYGIAYDSIRDRIHVGVDGKDRIISFNLDDWSKEDFSLNTQLNGNIRGMTILDNGDLLVNESNNVERFSPSGARVVTGWPVAIQSNPSSISAFSDGGFIQCSYGSNEVGVYDDDGVEINTRASGIGGTARSYGCTTLSDGRVAVGWNGSADTVQILSSDLSTVEASFSDSGVLINPYGMTEDNDGNLLVLDYSFHHIVKISVDGEFIEVLGAGLLNGPREILVIP